MKTPLLLLTVAFVLGCRESPNSQLVLMSATDSGCVFTMRHVISEKVGNHVVGTTSLVVSNAGREKQTISVPLQNALLLFPGRTSTFLVKEQVGQSVAPGATATFSWPFAMSESAMDARCQVILVVDGVSQMVEVQQMK